MIFDLRIVYYDIKVFRETEMGMDLEGVMIGFGKGCFGLYYTTTIR
jgi:hypothetical protein